MKTLPLCRYDLELVPCDCADCRVLRDRGREDESLYGYQIWDLRTFRVECVRDTWEHKHRAIHLGMSKMMRLERENAERLRLLDPQADLQLR